MVAGLADAAFGFTLDPCPPGATVDGLSRSWVDQTVFLNPPYRDVARWMAKAWREAESATVVALVAARTDTRWWHDFALRASEIRFIRGRLRFVDAASRGHGAQAPFPSAIVVFRRRSEPIRHIGAEGD